MLFIIIDCQYVFKCRKRDLIKRKSEILGLRSLFGIEHYMVIRDIWSPFCANVKHQFSDFRQSQSPQWFSKHLLLLYRWIVQENSCQDFHALFLMFQPILWPSWDFPLSLESLAARSLLLSFYRSWCNCRRIHDTPTAFLETLSPRSWTTGILLIILRQLHRLFAISLDNTMT